MDKIYIIVPVYNVELYLERCLNSLLAQTYKNIDIVLVDDGSNDFSPVICDSYAAKYENIFVIHQENRGLSGARNTGIEYVQQCKAKNKCWLTFIDSDDYIHPCYIEYLYSACRDLQVEISVCKYIRTYESIFSYPYIKYQCEAYTPEGLWYKDRTNSLIAVGKLYNSKCWQTERFPIGKIHEDEFTTYKVLFEQEKIAYLPNSMYYYFQTKSSIMHQKWRPERLQGLDALEEQMNYFQKRSLKNAYNRSLEAFCEHAIKHVRSIEIAAPEFNEYKRNVRLRMQRALSLYAKERGCFKALYFWYRFRIKNPMQKSLKQESLSVFLKRQIKRVVKNINKYER